MRIESSRCRAGHGWRAVRAVAVLGAGALIASLVAPAGAADRRPPVGPDLLKPQVAARFVYADAIVTSSEGKKLEARVEGHSSGSAETIGFSLALPSGNEIHTWNFVPAADGYDVNGDGEGTLTMELADTADFAELRVTVTPTSKFEAVKCGSKVASRSRDVKVKGVYFVDSKDAWGHVGSTSKATFVLKGQFIKTYDVDCHWTPPCQTGLSWSTSQLSPPDLSEYAAGWTSGKDAYSYGARYSSIADSSGGTRWDEVVAKAAKPKLKVKSDGSATLRVWIGSGSALLTSTGAKHTHKSACGQGKTQVSHGWEGTVSMGATPLTITMQAAPPILVSPDANAYFTQDLVKP